MKILPKTLFRPCISDAEKIISLGITYTIEFTLLKFDLFFYPILSSTPITYITAKNIKPGDQGQVIVNTGIAWLSFLTFYSILFPGMIIKRSIFRYVNGLKYIKL